MKDKSEPKFRKGQFSNTGNVVIRVAVVPEGSGHKIVLSNNWVTMEADKEAKIISWKMVGNSGYEISSVEFGTTGKQIWPEDSALSALVNEYSVIDYCSVEDAFKYTIKCKKGSDEIELDPIIENRPPD